MLIIDTAPALSTAFIWAWASVTYKDYMRRLSPLTVNFLRMLYTTAALTIPVVLIGLNIGAIWGSLSGLLSLAVGDSMYLMAINYSGVSVAAPISYSYIPLSVLMATLLGEPLTIFKVTSGLMIMLGVYLLSRERTRVTLKGVTLALGTAVAWAVGQTMIKVADVNGLNPVSVAFVRVATAGLVLLMVNHVIHNDLTTAIKTTLYTRLPLVAILDLGIGVALFAYSVDLIGLGFTVIVTGCMPLVAQLMAKFMSGEKLTASKLMGAVIIVLAIATAFIQ
ncbi:DMT family transporter [Caldivirga sp.]|uniref:DMT family transporter n=1 Tax=Caldivirga sp. TaxID=2080243 RepID=UPI0025BD63A8|nr:DMT family transporter [Caldivirga sp.]